MGGTRSIAFITANELGFCSSMCGTLKLLVDCSSFV